MVPLVHGPRQEEQPARGATGGRPAWVNAQCHYRHGVLRTVLATLLLAVLLAACAPTDTPAVPAPTPAPQPTTALVPLPERPFEIRVDDLDPCALLTPDEIAGLGLEPGGNLDVRNSALYGGVTALCSWQGFEPRAISVGVNLSVTGGIELFTERAVPGIVTALDIRGFPAVLARLPNFPEACSVILDVAEGQAVDVQFRDGGRLPRNPQADLCDGAQEVADLVMGGLLTR